ncbi:MAG: pyridoxamine 5'-phosphate oxidase family protein [Bacteroidales bacterium]|nr:pyridoxamine 5'-phosphate oxidase family protein [Bacteroidales bacterium]
MRRKDKNISDEAIIEHILHTADICRLGLVDKDEAYIVPVNYAYSNGTIIIHSAGNGRKIEIIRQNNKAAFEIEGGYAIETGEKACEWTTKYRSVMGKGIITIVTNVLQKKAGLDLIMKNMAGARMR